jgi:hypothetical protein
MTNYRAVVIAFIFVAIICAFVAGSFLPLSNAQENQPRTLAQIQVVSYQSGMTGFYDSSTGVMYVYDVNLDKCIFARQIVRLGEPMKKILN